MDLMTDRNVIPTGMRQTLVDTALNALIALGFVIEHIADARLDDVLEPWTAPHVIMGLATAVRILATEMSCGEANRRQASAATSGHG